MYSFNSIRDGFRAHFTNKNKTLPKKKINKNSNLEYFYYKCTTINKIKLFVQRDLN